MALAPIPAGITSHVSESAAPIRSQELVRAQRFCYLMAFRCFAEQPTNEVRRYHANFTYQAGSWTKPRRVVAKVEWHPGELYPRVGFIVTDMARPAENVIAFYNKRGTCEQWIKEGKGAIKWTRLSCRAFAANAVRLQLHALQSRQLPTHAGDAGLRRARPQRSAAPSACLKLKSAPIWRISSTRCRRCAASQSEIGL